MDLSMSLKHSHYNSVFTLQQTIQGKKPEELFAKQTKWLNAEFIERWNNYAIEILGRLKLKTTTKQYETRISKVQLFDAE